MNKAMFLIYAWHGFDANNFAIFAFLIFLINAVNAASVGVLDVDALSPCNTSRFDGGRWGGFLREGCSGGVFCAYLYALSVRANQTGEIYLKWDEEREWFSKRENGTKGGVLACGMVAAAAGGGGCSDHSTSAIKTELGHDFERLQSACGTTHCLSCSRIWEEIKTTRSEMCGFAVLITLISAEIEEEKWGLNVFSCLGNEQISSDHEAAEGAKEMKIGLVGGAAGVAILMIFALLMLSQRGNKAVAPMETSVSKLSVLRPALSESPSLRLMMNASGILNVLLEEVYAATSNLSESNIIGEGTSGKVYRGVMSNNQHVAIKKTTNFETFVREIRSLVHVKHPNLVALLAYCENGSECFLVYELCPNGSLSDWLYAGEEKTLSWLQRLEIALDSARGLMFLHAFPQGCIVHCDVKPANILLGENLEAKLSDFGLSKVMNLGECSVSAEMRGSFGYVDPDYQTNGHVSAASDVYSFGVVLLQILSGRKVIDMNMKQPKPLDKIARSVVKSGKMVEFADAKLRDEYSLDAFVVAFELALSCTGQKRRRPSMTQAVVKLEEALDISIQHQISPM